MSLSRRDTTILAVVLAVVALLGYWFVLLGPQRDELATVQAEVTRAEGERDAARAEVTEFRAARDAYQANYASVARLGKAVPADDDTRSLLVQLEGAADDAGVDFSSVELESAGAAGAAPAAAAPAGKGGAAQPATNAATATLPPGTSVGSAGLATMPLKFQFRGSFFKLSDYFARLEEFVRLKNEGVAVSGRLLTFDSISLKPEGFPEVVAEVGATSYLAPADQGLLGGATATAPAPAAPATPSVSNASATTTP